MSAKINSAMQVIAQKDLSNQMKAQRIFPIFDDVFDYKLMCKLSLGKANWTKMDSKQREEFTQKFTEHLKNSYVEKLNLYTDEKLKIVDTKVKNAKRISLLTELIGSKDTYAINYKFYLSKKLGWLIYDVNIIGVSLVQIYRAQFNNALENGSYKKLLARLDKSKK